MLIGKYKLFFIIKMEIEDLLDLIELILTQKDEVGDFVETIAKKNFVIDEEDLLVATGMRQIELVRFVLRSGVEPTLESFQYAAEHKFYELCSLFVEFGSRKILSTPELEEEFRKVCIHGLLGRAKYLINRGVDPTSNKNLNIQTSSTRGYFKIVRLLLKHEADPTANGNMAIQTASLMGHLEVVRLLLNNDSKYKVDPTTRNNYAIRMASGPNKNAIIELLKSRGASL